MCKAKDKLEDMDVFGHFLPSPEMGHDFHEVTVTQKGGQLKIPGCRMKDMDFVFPLMRNGLL